MEAPHGDNDQAREATAEVFDALVFYSRNLGVPDGCGVAPGTSTGTFIASSGRGGMVEIDARTGAYRTLVSDFVESGRWGNHLMIAEDLVHE